MRNFNRLLLVLLCGGLASAQTPRPSMELKYSMVVTRHGVRPPLWTAERLNEYSAQPWPDWGVPVGYLTDHGRVLMKIMGGYYRELYTSQGLLGKPDCRDAARTYWWSDTDERNVETSKALAETLLPGCKAEIHTVTGPKRDPFFDPVAAGVAVPDPAMQFASVSARLGPDPQAVVASNKAAFTALENVLNGKGHAAVSIFNQPVALTPGKTGLTMAGPLAPAATLSEALVLEYTDGMSGNRLGWGRVTAADILEISRVRAVYTELMWRSSAIAHTRGDYFLSRIEKSIEQAVQGKTVPGAIGNPDTALAVVSAHDSNIAAISGILDVSWQLPSYQPNETAPGGAMIFSLWKESGAGRYFVRMQYTAQTMDQQHDATPLTLKSGPPTAALFIPGCSGSANDYACEWTAFRDLITRVTAGTR